MVKKMYMGLPTVQLNNVIRDNNSLRTNYAFWDISSNYTVTQNDGYVTITLNTSGGSSAGAYACAHVFSSIVTGNTEETKQYLYWQAKVRGRKTNVSWPCIYSRYYTNGSTDPSYNFYVTAIDGASEAGLNDDNWHILSGGLSTTYNSNSGNYFDYDRVAFGIRNCTTVGDTMDICDILVLNLTTAFGSGNEPTKAWCDQNITYSPIYNRRIIDIYNTSRASVATRLPRGYIGVNGKARRIIKGYIGVNGKAQQFYGFQEQPAGNYNTINEAKASIMAASLPDYAVFAGGKVGTGVKTSVCAVNTIGIRSNVTDLTTGRYDGAGAATNKYILFAGGASSNYTVEGFDNNLIKLTNSMQLGSYRYLIAGASTNDYIYFAGGASSRSSLSSATFYSTVYAYNTSLARTSPTGLTTSRAKLIGVSCNNKAVFAGGYNKNSGSVTTIDAYDNGGSKITSTITNLSNARHDLAAAATDSYILFAGGYLDGGSTPCRISVEAYNSGLTKLDSAANLSVRRTRLAGARMGDYMVFAGGNDDSNYLNTIDVYKGLVKVDFIRGATGQPYALEYAKTDIAATSLKDKVLLAGGTYKNNNADTQTNRLESYYFE